MKRILSILFIVLGLSIVAQDNKIVDVEADKILSDLSAKYKTYKTAEMNVALTIDLPDVDENQIMDVRVWIKGDKFKIELKDQVFISDNKTLWNYMKEYNEVQINNYEESDAIFSPSVIFNLYKADYIYRMKESYKNSAGTLIKVLELAPINKDQNFFKIDLAVDSKNSIVEAKIYERSGTRYVYKIKDIKPNVELSDSFFTFDPSKYKDIEVIDARF